jgi:hypothetical protein
VGPIVNPLEALYLRNLGPSRSHRPATKEDPLPLPPDVRHICPRCGGEAEILQSRAQCLVCLLIFSPPRLPSWVVKGLWEGSRPQGGPLAVQGARRWVR